MSQSHEPHGGDDHGHDHGHSPFIQHHYDDAQHQFDSGKLGIWIFLGQEVLFFSALFVAYILYRVHHPEIYSYAHKYLDVKFGAINTAVLIFSSLTAAWAVRCAQLNQKKGLIACLTITLLCACTFLGIKYIEYTHKVHEHILFGKRFDPCVSSGGNELLTKNNECPGSKSTVKWNYGTEKPDAGCFDQADYDLQPHVPGVQAECVVYSHKVENYVPPTISGSGSIDCAKTEFAVIAGDGGNVKVTGTCAQVQIKGKNNTVTFDKVKKVQVAGSGNKISGTAADAVELIVAKQGDAAPADVQFGGTVDTSKPNAKTDVKTTVGDLAVDVTEKTRVIPDKNDKPLPQCALEGILAELAEGDAPKAEADKTGGEAKEVFPCWEAAVQPAVCGKVDTGLAARNLIKHIPQFGVLVRYNDHEERGEDIRIDATCTPAPKVAEPADVYATPATGVKLGDRAIQPQRKLTVHQEHELEAAGPPPEHTGMFFTIYFAMTGLHGIHVLVGVMVFIWLLIRAVKGHFSPEYFGPVDFAALYWHIVDLIWIFLFPLLYLIH